MKKQYKRAMSLLLAFTMIVSMISITSFAMANGSRNGDLVVMLDPGHGGNDPGGTGNNLQEKDLNLKIAQYCKEELEQYSGVKVYMTRYDDNNTGTNKTQALINRAEAAKNKGADVLIALHVNDSESGGEGVEIFYPNASYRPEFNRIGEGLANQMQNGLVGLGLHRRDVGSKDSSALPENVYPDGSRQDYYGIIRYSKERGVPALLVEHGFINNANDVNKFLNSDAKLQRLGVTDATSIAAYYGLTKGEPKVEIINKDDFKGTLQIKATGFGSSADIAMWSDINGQDDLRWYKITPSNNIIDIDLSDRGKHFVDMYCKGAMYRTTFNVSSDTSSLSTFKNIDGKETQYKATLTFADMPSEVEKITFAVWSDKGGQDDIVWYDARMDSYGIWTANIDIKNHRTAGEYKVDIYGLLLDNIEKKFMSDKFTVSEPTAKVRTENYNKQEGTFDVIVDGIVAPAGVSRVQVPVWSKANQSDLVWYNATKQSDGSYKVSVRVANHNYASGNYNVHMYMDTNNGLTAFGATSQTVETPEFGISAQDTNGKETIYELKLANARLLGDLTAVTFATWSDEDGAGKAIWYKATKSAEGTWTANADIRRHNKAGRYSVEVYGDFTNKPSEVLGKTEFTVSEPTAKVRTENYNKEAGTFDVIVDNISAVAGVSRVQVPVWSKDQSDLVWYDATKQSDGSYKVTVSLANHNLLAGNYTVHMYMDTNNGLTAFGATSQNVETPEFSISAQDRDGKETTYQLNLVNAGVLGNVQKVVFATWSNEGGQNDVVWYEAKKESFGKWTAIADVRNHKSKGGYTADMYVTVDGKEDFRGSTEFTVNDISVKSSVANVNATTGQFNIVISDIKSASGVGHIEVPVWSLGDQSDIHTYSAKSQGDGTYLVEVDPINHNYNSGLYVGHVYMTAGNGIEKVVSAVSQPVDATRFYTIMGATTATADQMVKYFQKSGKSYPSAVLATGGAPDIETFCRLFVEEANAEGVRAEVAFAQTMKETGWLQFGGIVKVEQFNFAGIGAIDGNAQGKCESFPDVRTGIRAQIQHLKAYGSKEALVNECVDPRFHLVPREGSIFVEWLGISDNPKGYGWATGKDYGFDIVKMIKDLKAL